jgi:hypothetical protein
MFGRVSDEAIFTLDRPIGTSATSLPPDQFLPYAKAWKEFDKLENAANRGGMAGWMRWGIDLSLGAVAMFQPYAFKGHKPTLAALWFGASAIAILYSLHAKRRFQHWPCPRCHSEWPGDKTQKDRACKMCGLHLHQMHP